MDPFAIIMLGGTLGLVIALVLAARSHPGSGADLIDWKPTRSPEVEAQNEIDDLAQMMEIANRRRRRLGQAEVTEDSLREDVARQEREAMARRESLLEEEEVEQMLGVVNRRRKRKGMPELTAAEYRAQFAPDEQEPEGGS